MPAYDDRRFTPAAPVASVTIRHPDTGDSVSDVPMLIDSGADATLLPRSAVASLGIAGTGEHYQLVGFDGTTNESEAARAAVIFMNETFRGRFLQVESDVGVIGRNVLNHVRLLLDGPALNWEESRPTRGDT
jgi:predicted aspartyl protease